MTSVVTPVQSPGMTPAASPGITPAASPLPGVSPRRVVQHSEVTPLIDSLPEVATPAASRPELVTPAASRPELATPATSRPELATPAASRPELATPATSRPELATPAASPKAYTPAASPFGRTPAASPGISPREGGTGEVEAPGRPQSMDTWSTSSGGDLSARSTSSRGNKVSTSDKVPIERSGSGRARATRNMSRASVRSKASVAEAWAKQKTKMSHKQQANNFRLKALDSISLEDMTHNDVHEVTRRDIFRQVLAKQRTNANGCVSLPVHIVFFVVYAFAARLHEDITNVWLIESAMRNLFLPDLTQLETLEDVWDWLSTEFVSEIFVQSDFYGQELPPDEWSRVLIYSQVQGSVLLTQSRDTDEPWGKDLHAYQLDQYSRDLYQSNAGFVPRSIMEGRRLALMKPSLIPSLPGASNDESTYDFSLYPTEALQRIRADLRYLKQRGWLDQHTKRLSIKFLLLNSELGRPRVEQLLIHLSLSRGGDVYAEMALQSLFLKSHDSFISLFVDLVWFCMLMVKTLVYLRELWMAFTLSTLKSHMTSGVTILEWIIICCGWINVVGFIWQMNVLTYFLNSLEDVIMLPRTASGQHATAEQEALSAQFHVDADNLIVVYNYWRMGLSWFTIILIFRFFAAFRAQPRLAVVTNTLTATFIDLVHFLVVFIPTFLAYAVSGNLLFGRRIEHFSTLQASIGVCLRIVFENEFEWLSLSEEHFATAAIWTWSLLIIVVLVMLNLVLAIILDIYNEVRSQTNSADTIFLYMKNVAMRLAHLGQWVKDGDLKCVLIDMDDHSTLSRTDLCEALPNLSPVQRDMLFDACRVEMAWQAKQDVRRQEFLKMSASIKLSIDQANTGLGDIEDEAELINDGGVDSASLREAAESRMQGLSRPFPGMPCTPGGYFPPILAPTLERPHVFVPPLDLPPEELPDWYIEMKQALSTSCDLMSAIKYEVETLQWAWYQLNEMHRPATTTHPEVTLRNSIATTDGGVPWRIKNSLTRSASKLL